MHSEESPRATAPGFTSAILPGSEAAQQERERLARFQADKAEARAQAETNSTETQARLRAKLEAADRAHSTRMAQERSARAARNRVLLPPWPER